MKEKKKVVITGAMVVNVVSVLCAIVGILVLLFDENKKYGIIFLVLGCLLSLSFNMLNNKNKKK